MFNAPCLIYFSSGHDHTAELVSRKTEAKCEKKEIRTQTFSALRLAVCMCVCICSSEVLTCFPPPRLSIPNSLAKYLDFLHKNFEPPKLHSITNTTTKTTKYQVWHEKASHISALKLTRNSGDALGWKSNRKWNPIAMVKNPMKT